MSTVYLYRALQALLQPCMGNYASGKVSVSAITGTASLPAYQFGFGSIRDCEMADLLVVVQPNPATPDHSWPLTTVPSEIPVDAVQGGYRGNMPVGTSIRWDPAPVGIARFAEVSQDFTGGDDDITQYFDSNFGALKQLVAHKDLGMQNMAQDFFQAQLGQFPGAVLAWQATTPANGSAVSGIGGDNLRARRGRRFFSHTYDLYLVTSRLDHQNDRRTEGDQLRDNVLRTLSDRHAFRGLAVSGPVGIQILDVRIGKVSESAFIDVVRFSCMFALERAEWREFSPLNRFRTKMSRPASNGYLIPTVDDTELVEQP